MLPRAQYADSTVAPFSCFERYMAKNAGSPQRVADAVCVALKTPSPQARYIVNRSWEMWALQYTPQWILDFAIRMQLA